MKGDKNLDEIKFGSKKDILLVNSVTASRFIGSFFIIPTFKVLGGIAAAIFSAIFLFTDFIDGQLARKLKSSTFFGAAFDGLTDKTFAITCLMLLMNINPLLFSILILMESKILLVQNQKMKNGQNIQSNITGKIKMWFLSASIVGSFVAVDLLNIPNIINYIKFFSLDKVTSIKQALALVGINVPSFIMQLLTLKSYNSELNNEKIMEEKTVDENINPLIKLEEIILEKEKLQEELSNLEKLKMFADKMFDPVYYSENKDMPIRKLTKDLFKKN